MTIFDTDTIDHVAFADDHVALVQNDSLTWGGDFDDMEHVYLLQENINTCIAYYESGQFKRDHPEDAQLPLIIVLVPIEPLAEEGQKLIEAARPVVEGIGMKIVVDQDFAKDPDNPFSEKAH